MFFAVIILRMSMEKNARCDRGIRIGFIIIQGFDKVRYIYNYIIKSLSRRYGLA